MQGWMRAINTVSVRRPMAPQYTNQPIHSMKYEKGKAVGDKKGASS